jgi:capsular polysaccharide biosynthesis protein
MMDLNIRIAFWIGDLIIVGYVLKLAYELKQTIKEAKEINQKKREHQMLEEVLK